jgi:hypothetical protein
MLRRTTSSVERLRGMEKLVWATDMDCLCVRQIGHFEHIPY